MHESARVFRDRLVDETDRGWFNELCASKLKKHFRAEWKVEEFKDTLYADWLSQVLLRCHMSLARLAHVRQALLRSCLVRRPFRCGTW